MHHRLNRISRKIFWPDVSPLDFRILGTVKSKMPFIEIYSEEELKETIESILSDL